MVDFYTQNKQTKSSKNYCEYKALGMLNSWVQEFSQLTYKFEKKKPHIFFRQISLSSSDMYSHHPGTSWTNRNKNRFPNASALRYSYSGPCQGHLLPIPQCWFDPWLLHFQTSFLLSCIIKAVLMVQVLGPLFCTRKARIEFLDPDMSLANVAI